MAFNFKQVFSSLQKASNEQPKKVVGIDFGSSSLKVVELEHRSDDVLALTTYGELQLGPYAESDMGSSVKLPLQKKIAALVDVMRESGVTAKDAVLSLPLSDSFVTVISLAAKQDEDISPRVHVEARKYIPVPITDVALEWTEIEQQKGASALSREVLVAAIQNTSLADMKTILDSIQMTSRPSEIEIFSSLRAITKESDTSVAIIDVGASISKLYIAEAGFLQRIHRVQAGGMHATSAIAKHLSVSFEEAENIKRNYTSNGANADVVKKAITTTFDRAFQEFKRVINQYEVRRGVPITRIVFTGGTVSFHDFSTYCAYQFDREIEITNPFTKVAYPAFMEDTLASIAPVFAVALGAALRPYEQ